MALMSLGVLTTGVSSGTAVWEIRCSSSARAYVMELGFFLNAATATLIGLGRPAAIGVTPTSPVDFQPEDPANPIISGECQSALAWGTAPTIPTNFLRRIGLPATVGVGVIWTWPRGLVIPSSGSIVLWNTGGSSCSALNAYAVCDVT
jgi:hypothetical protein